jgi:hypothetical protein
VNLWQRPEDVFEHVEEEAEERPLTKVELDAVFDASFEGLRAVGADAREIRPKEAASHHEEDLILVVDVTVGELFGEQLVKDDAEGVDVGLERVGVLFVHSDDFWCHPVGEQPLNTKTTSIPMNSPQNRPRRLILPRRARPSNLRRCQTEIANLHGQVVVEENIVRFEIAVNDAFGVQIVHALRHLSSDVDERVQLELCLVHVDVLVETAALAPLRHDCERGFADAAHEQQDVAVTRLLQHGDFVLERLQLRRCRRFHVQSLDGDRPVPVS